MYLDLYNDNLSLLVDKYELTMAKSAWGNADENKETSFAQFYRKNPFVDSVDGQAGYGIATGTEVIKQFLHEFEFTSDDIDYLSSLRDANNQSMFPQGFLNYLSDMELDVDVYAVPSGTVVFPFEPILRVEGPYAQCQLLETALLNIINFNTLVATKASRMVQAANGKPVLEFGARRAQGPDGAVSASRASYIGGVNATSNMLAGKYGNIPTKGTHAHSWVQFYASEYEAFKKYSDSYPRNCILLIDTYDTMEGLEKAIDIGKDLESRGSYLKGVRIDSGDLKKLCNQVRDRLDEEGFDDTWVIPSGDLDEYKIKDLEENSSCDAYPSGTRLATCHDQPSLGGVYKFQALKEQSDKRIIDSEWTKRIKVSENPIKTTIPGLLQTRRFYEDVEVDTGNKEQDFTKKVPIADMIIDESMANKQADSFVERLPNGETRTIDIEDADESAKLLNKIMEDGELVDGPEEIGSIRRRVQNQLDQFDDSITCIDNPERFSRGIESNFYQEREELINEN